MKSLYCITTLILLSLATHGYAFKIDTHIWIGQQVIEDLQDGYLTIKLGEEQINIHVNEKITQAILENPSVYRAGNIGPDSFPDIFSGQTIVHPGISDGWKTSDWLKYLIDEAVTPEEIAFVYGYLGHAASDIFSHTYVNRYAGGVFDLVDDNHHIELRHILLEKFISEHTPEFAEKFHLSIPLEFIVDKLIDNEIVSSIHGNNDATTHLKLFYDLKQEVRELQNSKLLKDLDIEITKYIVQIATGIEISDKIAKELDKIQDDITKIERDSIELAGKIHGELLRIDGQIMELTGKAVDKSVDSLLDSLNSAISEAKRAYERYYDARMKVIDIQKKLVTIPKKIEKEVCKDETKWISGILFGFGGYFTTEMVCHIEEITNPIFQAQEKLLKAEKHAVEKLSKGIGSEITEVKKLVHEITGTLIATQRTYLKVIEKQYELFAEMLSDRNPIRSLLIMWENNIDRSVEQYVYHMYLAMVDTMKKNGNPISIMKEWVQCWAWGLLSVPTQFTTSTCLIEDSYEKISDTLNKIIAYINPAERLAQKLKAKLDDEIHKAKKNILIKLIERILDDEVVKIMKASISNNDIVKELEIAFSEDSSNSGILLIPDVVDRVSTEMHFTQTGKFDPDKYPVIYDAIVMTKLTLLSHNQLNKLVAEVGINGPTLYGDTLYPEDNTGNVLFKAVRSIDGNHQWSEYAPQPPYRNGYVGRKNLDELQFGFGFDPYLGTGMRIWQDPNVREKLFRKIFIGPLVPGIDAPETIGFSPVNLMINYYDTCVERPFPDDIYDNTCTNLNVTKVETYINKCINNFSNYFGSKIGSIYLCHDDNYYCQKTTGGLSSIAIHKLEREVFWYYWDKWYFHDLSYCD